MSGQIAIVGAGPSGCYLAQALLKLAPDLKVDLIDALPVPFGLTRYGVAADHQGTKAVTRQFARTFERQGARFFGNVRVGRDLSLAQISSAYDATVLAAGLSSDRPLDIPGGDLPQVYGSARLTRALNEHPDAAALPDLGAHPVILGNGNVAVDLLRILCKTPAELEGSDLGPGPTAWLAANNIETITIVGRSPAAKVKFDPVMVRELGKLDNIHVTMDEPEPSSDPEEQKKLQALHDLNGHGTGSIRVDFRFEAQPLAVEGDSRVTGLRVAGAEIEEIIGATSLITAIGFMSDGELNRDALIAKASTQQGGKLDERLYSAGWFRHGPRGTIPQSRADAQDTAALILSDLTIDPARTGATIFAQLPDCTDYPGWQQIDRVEQGQSLPGRCRQKITSIKKLINVAKQRGQNL
ncbi:oxidoreductase [Roseibium polysiphoniae]|uniref:Oxidoreductase n=1 Tax=Roseibium polysiphoniae TaxID=2571221 RepID=A0A944CGT9_9HYPH|nr:FAD-dependent oxidoreductase [Roseibium polysiphoniae]MBS8262769.1 oxidoreductase [Roseibium polysiphoniae]